MGLFDGYLDPEQFGNGGGLLGRLLALQQMQAYRSPPPDDQPPPAPPAPLSLPTPWPNAGGAGLAPAAPLPASPSLQSQFETLRPVLGDHHAMLATIHPEAGQEWIARALADQSAASQSGGANAAGSPASVASSAPPSPDHPGMQVAQAPLALCGLGPAACAAGAGLSAGQWLLGGALLGGGALILNNNSGERPPPGSRPINETEWSGDHKEIKRNVGADRHDDVRIAPNGDVWAQKPDGSWENHGPADTFTGSGKASGRRGKDRDGW